jgi:glycosyltransferase involved in cell wall biosynthesis
MLPEARTHHECRNAAQSVRHGKTHMSTILINGSHPQYLINFRGPLIRDLVARGHRVHVSSPNLEGFYRDEAVRLGATPHDVPLRRTGMSISGDIAYHNFIHRLIRNVGADFVLNYTIKPNIWGSLAARRAGARSASMVTGLGFAFIKGRGRGRAMTQRIAQHLYRMATDANAYVVFQNPDDLSDFIRAGCLGDPAKAVIVNGSGLDLDHYHTVPLPAGPVFLSLARLLRSKGLEEYADAAVRVRKEIPEARFLLAGMLDTGPDAVSREELDRWIASGIEYLGHLDDVRPAIAQASAFVLPSWREGTPRTVLEAMSMGRPVVTTDAPGCRETVSNGVNGYLVPVRDSENLAKAMIKVGRNPEVRSAMGSESRRIAERKYSVHEVNQDLIKKLGL